MSKFRKKPVVIEAVQWKGNNVDEISAFASSNASVKGNTVIIGTLEGNMNASVNDWIIKGVNGEFYPCKPDIFEKTYEPVED